MAAKRKRAWKQSQILKAKDRLTETRRVGFKFGDLEEDASCIVAGCMHGNATKSCQTHEPRVTATSSWATWYRQCFAAAIDSGLPALLQDIIRCLIKREDQSSFSHLSVFDALRDNTENQRPKNALLLELGTVYVRGLEALVDAEEVAEKRVALSNLREEILDQFPILSHWSLSNQLRSSVVPTTFEFDNSQYQIDFEFPESPRMRRGEGPFHWLVLERLKSVLTPAYYCWLRTLKFADPKSTDCKTSDFIIQKLHETDNYVSIDDNLSREYKGEKGQSNHLDSVDLDHGNHINVAAQYNGVSHPSIITEWLMQTPIDFASQQMKISAAPVPDTLHPDETFQATRSLREISRKAPVKYSISSNILPGLTPPTEFPTHCPASRATCHPYTRDRNPCDNRQPCGRCRYAGFTVKDCIRTSSRKVQGQHIKIRGQKELRDDARGAKDRVASQSLRKHTVRRVSVPDVSERLAEMKQQGTRLDSGQYSDSAAGMLRLSNSMCTPAPLITPITQISQEHEPRADTPEIPLLNYGFQLTPELMPHQYNDQLCHTKILGITNEETIERLTGVIQTSSETQVADAAKHASQIDVLQSTIRTLRRELEEKAQESTAKSTFKSDYDVEWVLVSSAEFNTVEARCKSVAEENERLRKELQNNRAARQELVSQNECLRNKLAEVDANRLQMEEDTYLGRILHY